RSPGFAASLSPPALPLGIPGPPRPGSLLQPALPHHHSPFQPSYPLGSVPEGHSLKSDSGLLAAGALWDMENVVPPMQASYAGTPTFHADNSHADSCEEAVQLREAVLAGRARLQQAEHEAEQWKEELRRLQAHSKEQGVQILSLRQERQAAQETNNRLQHEASLLQQQLCESRELMHSLQSELQVYDRVHGSTKASQGGSPSWLSPGFLSEVPGLPLDLPLELGELLGEVRSLRAQLQSSVQESSALKQLELHKQLEQKLGLGSPRTPSLSTLTASPQRDSFYRRQLLHGEGAVQVHRQADRDRQADRQIELERQTGRQMDREKDRQ
ncbi:hypothetical protein CRUP_019301, partial [Coryphaenoides rupestris]